MWVLGLAVRTEKRVFAGALLGSALYGSMTVGAAWAVGWATNHVVLPAFDTHHTSAGTLAAGGLLIVAVAVAKVLGIFGRRLLAGVLQFRMQARFRREVTAAYLRLPLSWHQQRPTGRLLSNANSDVEMSFMPVAPMPMSLGVIVMLIMAVVDMFLTNSVLALVGVLLFPAVIATNTVYVRYSGPRFARAQELRAHVAEVAHESFDGALVVKTLGREAAETERFAVRTRELRDANVAAGRARSMFTPALEALPNLGVLAVLLFGTQQVAAGHARPGDVVNIAYLITLLAFPIQAIGWVLGDLPRAVVGYERVAAVLAAEDHTDYGAVRAERHRQGAAALEFDRVEFAYPGAEGAPVLRGLSASVAPGRTVALVGATGAGKSTLAALLARLADPTGGAIRLDGTVLGDYAKGAISDAVALVPQQTFIFGDTVRANVILGAELSDEAVWAALRTAQAERFVRALPAGLDTVIGERGTTLSGGQRQRLALARALVRRPRLLVLDDCTSAVDPSVEAAILDGLREQGGPPAADGAEPGATVVVIAYRKATVALADEVLFLEDGAIGARGTHEELLTSSPGYRDLLTAYAKAAEEAEAEAASEADAQADAAQAAVIPAPHVRNQAEEVAA
ncbi:ABC transporter ATP-binding protein [Actinospica durhamensis]|uniref:ABC transporter ATP-binding protein n=1 Tax=Actinospica durhamensis TaxID=1508375 RepID=A0A941ETM0_9ACTN|nr:ABC transporter ATP-binding protein [Actinospica durhamensis]